jgi:two-component system, cell cycle sensor histidine kinase and response regulator CckA
MKVLIVDDEEPIRELVQRVLERTGFTIVLASDGPSALAAADTIDRLDLLITDLNMPAMSGEELARRLQIRDPDLKVLYVTGFSDRLFSEKVTLWEHEAFLDKPFTVQGLLEAVSLIAFGHTHLDASGGTPASVAAPRA